MEKFSEVLQRNAVFKKTSKINKLPSYLCVQFVRFYWKKESNVGGTKAGKAKILRSVMYPKVLDLYNFCSDSLKQTLNEGRLIMEKQRIEEDVLILEGKKKVSAENDKQASG
jgi:ubiquitin carboxyl-terminal hydrolase 14